MNKYLYTVGFCFFIFPVILSDFFGYVTYLYFFLFIPLFPLIKYRKAAFRLSAELIIYLLIVLLSEMYYGKITLSYLRDIVMLFFSVAFAVFLSTQSLSCIYKFVNGLIIGIIPCIIYYFIFASADDSSLFRYTLPMFSASSLGFMSSIIYYYGLAGCINDKKRKTNVFFMVLGISCMMYAMSKNAILSLIIVTLGYLIIRRKIRLSNVIIAVGVLVIFISIFQKQIDYIFDFLSTDMEHSSTDELSGLSFNGRGPIWQVAFDYFMQHPLIGNGYNSAEDILVKYTYNSSRQAHSAFFQLLLTVGVIGTISFLLFFFKYLFKAFKSVQIKGSHLLDWSICVYLYITLRCFTEGSIAQNATIDIFIYFLVIAVIMFFKSKVKPCNYSADV